MNAHISENQNNLTADQQLLSNLLDFSKNLDTGIDNEEFDEIKKAMVTSGMTSEDFLALLGSSMGDMLLDRPREYVGIQLLTKTAQIPEYANRGDACADIYADEEVDIAPGETHCVSTGIALGIPNGFVCHIYPRSGLSVKSPLRLANSVGVIDAGYRDEVKVPIWNSGSESYHIEKGMRIAQIDISLAPMIDFEEVKNVKEIGEDRGGGFGHSGLFEMTSDNIG